MLKEMHVCLVTSMATFDAAPIRFEMLRLPVLRNKQKSCPKENDKHTEPIVTYLPSLLLLTLRVCNMEQPSILFLSTLVEVYQFLH